MESSLKAPQNFSIMNFWGGGAWPHGIYATGSAEALSMPLWVDKD